MAGALAAVVIAGAMAASAATVYVPSAPLYAPTPEYAPTPTENAERVRVPVPGAVVLDNSGNALPRCRERGAGVLVMRGTGCMP